MFFDLFVIDHVKPQIIIDVLVNIFFLIPVRSQVITRMFSTHSLSLPATGYCFVINRRIVTIILYRPNTNDIRYYNYVCYPRGRCASVRVACLVFVLIMTCLFFSRKMLERIRVGVM